MWAFTVVVHSASDLRAADVFTSDPYIEVMVGGCYTKCTSVKRNTLNPVYEETLTFFILDPDANFVIRAMDWDWGVDDHLGYSILSIEDATDRGRFTVSLEDLGASESGDIIGSIDLTCEIEELSFEEIEHLGLDDISIEGVLHKTPGGQVHRPGLRAFVPRLQTQRRYFSLRSTYLAYYHLAHFSAHVTDTGDKIRAYPDHVSLFDEDTIIRLLPRKKGIPTHSMELRTRRRNFHVRAKSDDELHAWVDRIGLALQEYRAEMEDDELNSFVPVRSNINAISFNCGKDAYEKIASTLESARESIFIADWWISPHVLLRMKEGQPPREEDRLSTILLKKAQEGVMVYVLIYREIEKVLNLFSLTAKRHLRSLHKNIRVMRHPEASLQNVANVYWSHHQKIVVVDQEYAFVGGLDLCLGRRDTPDHPCVDNGPYPQYPGVEYYNQNAVKIPKYKSHHVDVVDRQALPRLPWQDIHCMIDGAAARDVARNFIERWNAHRHSTKAIHKQPAIAPKIVALHADDPSHSSDSSYGGTGGTCEVQIVRSCGPWSLQLDREQSILHAYQSLISEAEHYVYIENQFFISSLPKDGIKNNITELLYRRVSNAIEHDKTFRVIVVLPLHPEGDLKGGDKTMLSILHYQMKTISQGKHSLLGRFTRDFPDYDFDDYFSFHCLRSWGEFEDGRLVTEGVYVHSKLMIVDDRAVIMGSANINERSMRGYRDSEIAAVIQDQDFVDNDMDGEDFEAATFAIELRKKVWAAHLGLTEDDIEDGLLDDPISDDTYHDLWKATSEENTSLFEQVFEYLPSDDITDLAVFKDNPEVWHGTTAFHEPDAKAKKTLKKVQGTITDYPLSFLEDMNLAPSGALAVAGNTVLI